MTGSIPASATNPAKATKLNKMKTLTITNIEMNEQLNALLDSAGFNKENETTWKLTDDNDMIETLENEFDQLSNLFELCTETNNA